MCYYFFGSDGVLFMNIIIYLICVIILLRYVFVLNKYIKTGIFKKKKCKSNIFGVIAYTLSKIFIIAFLILIILVTEKKSTDIVTWIIFFSLLLFLVMYLTFWQQIIYEYVDEKKNDEKKKNAEEFISKYGSIEYDKLKIKHFDIPNYALIDDKFNELISMITNNELSFIHPTQYKDIADVFTFLYQKDYLNIMSLSDTLKLTCGKVEKLLKMNNLNIKISSNEITKNDDKFITNRRNDFVSTMTYDLNITNDIVINKSNGYELVGIELYDQNNSYNFPSYLCIMKSKDYEDFFGDSITNREENINE